MDISSLKKNQKAVIGVAVGLVVLVAVLHVFAPKSSKSQEVVRYTVEKGSGYETIGRQLKEKGVIRSSWAFEGYALLTGRYKKLQAGVYDVSPAMSVAVIAKKIATGDVVTHVLTVIEGWDIQDIGQQLENSRWKDDKPPFAATDFALATKEDFSKEFAFLADKPKALDVEGYLFPDTYQLRGDETQKDVVKTMLRHFDKKLSPELRAEITKQKKTIFQIVTMASILEKEVQTPADKKTVSGILWKRIKNGMPLQVDASILYVTGNDSVRIADTKINSPYNTYRYYGLPKGPISNPGMDSIMAAIYPEASPYWYYLSAEKDGKTIFSKTFQEHQKAIAEHL